MRRTVFLTAALIFIAAATAFAQPNEQSGQGRQGGQEKAGKQNRARLRERIEMVKMWKLTQALDLDEATAEKLFPLLNQYEDQQRQLRVKRAELLKQLNDELKKDSADPAILRKTVDEYKKNDAELVQTRNQRMDDLSKILSEKQMAQLIVFVPRFEREVKNLMNDVRARRRLKDYGNAGQRGTAQCPLGNEPMRRQGGNSILDQADAPPAQ
jgi:hypothetical protein